MHRSRRSSGKRAAILDAARHCFLDMGFAGTSMDVVAGRAGVSKATIYAHFAGKDDLFGAIIRHRCEQVSAARLMEGKGKNVREALTGMARQLMQTLLAPEALGMYRVVAAEAARQPELARAYFEAGPVQGKANLAAALSALAERGDLRIDDPWRAADLFVGMLRGGEYFNRALLGLPQLDGRTLDGAIDGAVDTFLRAFV